MKKMILLLNGLLCSSIYATKKELQFSSYYLYTTYENDKKTIFCYQSEEERQKEATPLGHIELQIDLKKNKGFITCLHTLPNIFDKSEVRQLLDQTARTEMKKLKCSKISYSKSALLEVD